MRKNSFFERGNLAFGIFTVAVTSLLAATLFSLITQTGTELAAMRIEPTTKTLIVDETFPVSIVVSAPQSVNAFTGELVFSNDTVTVTRIDYNTDVADLWVTEPWYNKADNTVYFAGGTTKPGGFSGTDTLITVHLRSTKSGQATLSLKDVQILAHDGLGTDLPLSDPVDALFTSESIAKSAVQVDINETQTYAIVPTPPTFDVTGDGKVSFADISALLLKLGSDDARFDFNLDGKVNQSDLTLLLNNRS